MAQQELFFGLPIKNSFVTDTTPKLQADTIGNVLFSKYNVKITLVSHQVELKDGGQLIAAISGQITMPVDGFVNAYLFLTKKYEEMKAAGIITEDLIREMSIS